MSKHRKCARCCTKKTTDEFYYNISRNTHDAWCKNCRCEYNKKKRRESPLSFSEFYRISHLAHLHKDTNEMIKRCSSCEKLKSIDNFHKRKQDTSDGYRGSCKTCHNQSAKTWKKNNPDKCSGYYKRMKTQYPERYIEYTRRHYAKHQEERKRKRREYSYTHRHEENERMKKYIKRKKEQSAADQFFIMAAAAQELTQFSTDEQA
jgi:hypothetical protein